MRLTFLNSLSPVALFLYDFCREIVGSIEATYLPENKDLMERILASKAAPQDARQSKALITFLKRRFNLDWLDKAKVVLENENALRIAYGSNSMLIQLDNSNTRAVLIVRRKRKSRQFVVDVFSDNYLGRNKSVMTRDESLEFILPALITHLVPTFIFSLASNVPSSSDDLRILSRDKTFLDMLEKTKKQFNNKCEILAKMRSASLS